MYANSSWSTVFNELITPPPWIITLLATTPVESRIRRIMLGYLICARLYNLVGLRRVKIKIGSLAIFQHVSDALVDSKCTLEELDVTFKFRPRRRFRAPVGQIVRSIEVASFPRTCEMFLGKLQVCNSAAICSHF